MECDTASEDFSKVLICRYRMEVITSNRTMAKISATISGNLEVAWGACILVCILTMVFDFSGHCIPKGSRAHRSSAFPYSLNKKLSLLRLEVWYCQLICNTLVIDSRNLTKLLGLFR